MPTDFERAVQSKLGSEMSWQELDFLAYLRLGGDFALEDDEYLRARIVGEATDVVRKIRELFGAIASTETNPGVGPQSHLYSLTDGRWALLDDLRERFAEESGLRMQRPISAFDIQSRVLGQPFCYPQARQVVITADGGLPLRDVLAELRGRWPGLRDAGHVRRTRALEARALALVRFNCLEQDVDTKWRDRLATWNRTHPDWAYADVRPFQSDFKRAETSLSGEKNGLAWFYDSAARTQKSSFEASEATVSLIRLGIEMAQKSAEEKVSARSEGEAE